MNASLPSFTRALSPAGAALASSIASGGEAFDENSPRLMSLSLASGFNEVVGLLPLDYREVLRPSLRLLSELAEKHIGVRNALNKLKEHKA